MKRKDKIAIFSFSFCVCEKKLKGGHEMSKNTKLEKDFQSKLIKELKKMFVGCMVMKLDSSYIQGIPDLLVLYGNKWASLECKRNEIGRAHV